MVDLQSKSLYDALGVSTDATQAEVRKAYMKLALQLHPDKNPGDESAAAKFQTLQKVYSILSDADRRKVYDATGSIEDAEELAGDQFNDLYNYYRSMYAKVTEEDIDSFHSGYRGSEEERAQVLKYYRQFKGDMRQVFGWVMCSDEAADAHRFMDLLDAAIQAKEAPSFPKYAAWAKKVAAKPRPAEGAAQGSQARAKGRGKGQQQGAEAALVAQIRGRQQRALTVPAGGVLGRLMAEMENSEPSEEDFQKARQRLDQKRAGGKPQKNKAAGAAASGSGSKRAKR